MRTFRSFLEGTSTNFGTISLLSSKVFLKLDLFWATSLLPTLLIMVVLILPIDIYYFVMVYKGFGEASLLKTQISRNILEVGEL